MENPDMSSVHTSTLRHLKNSLEESTGLSNVSERLDTPVSNSSSSWKFAGPLVHLWLWHYREHEALSVAVVGTPVQHVGAHESAEDITPRVFDHHYAGHAQSAPRSTLLHAEAQ
eukprot:CAMPEP_0173171226 /NCGR_PEP_ID=MMETSP1141-20130122/1652_1 /TAXON_ID=483371 /ORGANISM="non described non described, Strain CCMP2298" /LENGTH=113 /DNA_ID=CAMNT_0014093161 /DNA_START=126 /DNA_END=467 /DNA_ORIENTATION=-